MAAVDKPKTVGRYTRREKIAYGNFGVVYKGVDTQTNRVVAIKTLDLDAVNDEVESVQHEVELLSHLSMAESSNVTKYYGTVLEGSKLWIVMDMCSGGSIRTLLKAGPLDDRYLSVIFRELTVAVVAVHREGIIHRDIKAANVLITMAGNVKLCDFGVAANTSLSSQAKRQTIVGTPYWMAPEVITEGQSYTNKADIWSMGITLYEITTGNPPYSEHEAMRALMLITHSRPPRLEGPKYNPSLKDLVALCLDEDPEARPSAETVLKHKFLRAYAKTPTSILRSLVDRYISWKNVHSDHRDSLLMFNPHQDNDETVSIAPSSKDDDTDSVWDFNVEEEQEEEVGDAAAAQRNGSSSMAARALPEDLSDAPDSLRELFGVPPKRDDEDVYPRRLQHGITNGSYAEKSDSQPPSLHQTISAQSMPPSQMGTITSSHAAVPSQSSSQASLLPSLQAARSGSLESQQLGSDPAPHIAPQDLGPSLRSANPLTSQSHPQIAQGFVFPPAKPHQEKPQLARALTAASVARSRSTTVAMAPNRAVGPRSRHGSDAHANDSDTQASSSASLNVNAQTHTPTSTQLKQLVEGQATVGSQSGSQLNPNQKPGSVYAAGAQLSGSQVMGTTPSSSGTGTSTPNTTGAEGPPQWQQSPTAAANGSPNTSPSPKRMVARRQVAPEVKSRVVLPRLQMPPRNAAKPLPLMSAPAGSVKHLFAGAPAEGAAASANGFASPGAVSANDSGSSASSSMKRMLGWPSEFPPMPKIDTNVLLDCTPDELVVDHLLELTTGFRTAVASLASQFENDKF